MIVLSDGPARITRSNGSFLLPFVQCKKDPVRTFVLGLNLNTQSVIILSVKLFFAYGYFYITIIFNQAIQRLSKIIFKNVCKRSVQHGEARTSVEIVERVKRCGGFGGEGGCLLYTSDAADE